jgi:hypothetical protein
MKIMCGYLMTTGTIIMHEEATSKKAELRLKSKQDGNYFALVGFQEFLLSL